MKKKLPIIIICVGLSLFGCSTINPLNSQEHVKSLVSSFSNECQKSGGKIGTPTDQGAYAVCIKQGGYRIVNMYINSSFIFILGNEVGQKPMENRTRFYAACAQNGDQRVYVSEGKDRCQTSTWLAEHQPIHPNSAGKEISQVTVSFPRDNKGEVKESNWGLALSFY